MPGRFETTQLNAAKADQKLFSWIEALLEFHLRSLAKGLLRLFHLVRQEVPRLFEEEPDSLPTGPFITRGAPALLLFVTHNLRSQLIDELSGGYGYYHAAVDCGEVDEVTGKAVMTESMPGSIVRRVFRDRYGSRPFIRLSIEQMGVDPASFCSCVQSHLGEPYDFLEVMTWGAIDDPARQICSNLATQCLPEEMHQRIASLHQAGCLPPLSISVHQVPEREKRDIFISPNAFALYFQAPKGRSVLRPNTDVEPRPMPEIPFPDVEGKRGNSQVIAGLAVLAFALVLAILLPKREKGG